MYSNKFYKFPILEISKNSWMEIYEDETLQKWIWVRAGDSWQYCKTWSYTYIHPLIKPTKVIVKK